MSNELSQSDKGLAKWVADCIKQDGVSAEQFAQDPRAFVEAYGDVVARKIAKIQNICLARDGAKEVMRDLVLSKF